MTTGRINQVDIVPPSEEQPRHIALTKGSLDTYIALTKRQPRHIHRTYQRQPRHMHRTYPKAASTHTSHLPSAASTHTSHLPKGSLDTHIALTIGSLDTSHLPSHGGLPNSFATECRRPPQGMTPRESSHMKSRGRHQNSHWATSTTAAWDEHSFPLHSRNPTNNCSWNAKHPS